MADELARCLERLRATELACQETEDLLASLLEKKALLELDRQRYQAEAKAICSRLYKRPLVGLSSCPNDVLLCIFEQLCIVLEARWIPEGGNTYDKERARCPFYVAAVCSRWRQLALGFARLWNYVGLPSPDVDDSRLGLHRSPILLALERSKSLPIDVLVEKIWTFSHDRQNAGDNILAWFLSSIGSHSSRWGRVELWRVKKADLRLFTSPTPLLTHLLLNTRGIAIGPSLTAPFLPFAPRLCCLTVDSVDAEDLCEDEHPGLPSLISLDVLGDTRSWRHILLFLVSGSESLETVGITIARYPQERLHETSLITLPKLSSLVVTMTDLLIDFDDPWSWHVSAPNLTSLRLEGEFNYHTMVPLLLQVAPTVTHLTLCEDRMQIDDLDSLQHLRNVSHLSFGPNASRMISGENYYFVYDDFFSKIADSRPPIWPRLTRIELGGHGAYNSSYGEGLLRLIGSRSHFREYPLPGVDIITEVVVGDDQSSPPLKDAIARLMAL